MPYVGRRRRGVVSSQLMGLVFTRFILWVPPVSTATPVKIAAWAGPTLDRYMVGPIDGSQFLTCTTTPGLVVT